MTRDSSPSITPTGPHHANLMIQKISRHLPQILQQFQILLPNCTPTTLHNYTILLLQAENSLLFKSNKSTHLGHQKKREKKKSSSYCFDTMDSISSVSPSIVLPPKTSTPLQNHRRRITLSSPFLKPTSQFRLSCYCQESGRVRRRCHHHTQVGRHGRSIRMAGAGGGGGGEKDEEENRGRDEEVERALHLDGSIPGSSNEFVKQVSSRAYDMRRHLQQTFDSSSYDGKSFL